MTPFTEQCTRRVCHSKPIHVSRMWLAKRCGRRGKGETKMATAILALFCLSFTFLDANCKSQELESRQEESRQIRPRGYGYAHPFLPFLEPLSILAVIGFLAFLIQTFHAIYHTHHFNHNAGLGGLGGLLNNVLPAPTLHKKLESEGARRNDDVFKAIQFYEDMKKRRRRRNREKFADGNNVKSPTI